MSTDAKIRDLERSVKQVSDRVTQHADRARRYLQHHYQSMPAIGRPADHLVQLAANDLDIALYPVHLDRPMELRRLYFVAGSLLTGEDPQPLRLASAIYRAIRPNHGTRAELIAAPGAGVTFTLHAPLGATAIEASDAVTYMHTTSKDVELLDGLPYFVAFMFGNAKGTLVYTPQDRVTCVDGFKAAEPAPAFGVWPETLRARLDTQALVPFFVLRSPQGVKLYGNPEE